MWAADRLSIALEHRATEITARQIERIRARAPRRRALGATAAVACVAGEQHAMGARIVADLLFLDGWRVDFLGPNVPGEVIAEFVAEQGTNVVVLSVVLEDHVASVGEAVAAVRRSAPSAKILVGGPGIDEAGVLLAGADAHVATAEDVALVARNAAGVPMQLSLYEVLGLIGKRIEAERKMRKMSQQALADASGLDRAYISNVERGKQNVTIAALLRFADALGLSLGQLIDE
ncbi:MAG: cobalamin-dependent protein [Chloroflexota bacterium]